MVKIISFVLKHKKTLLIGLFIISIGILINCNKSQKNEIIILKNTIIELNNKIDQQTKDFNEKIKNLVDENNMTVENLKKEIDHKDENIISLKTYYEEIIKRKDEIINTMIKDINNNYDEIGTDNDIFDRLHNFWLQFQS